MTIYLHVAPSPGRHTASDLTFADQDWTRTENFLSAHLWQRSTRSTAVFLKLFYSIAPFHTRHIVFAPQNLIKQTQCSKFEEFYLKKLLNSCTKQLKTEQSNIVFRCKYYVQNSCGNTPGLRSRSAGAGHSPWSWSSN